MLGCTLLPIPASRCPVTVLARAASRPQQQHPHNPRKSSSSRREGLGRPDERGFQAQGGGQEPSAGTADSSSRSGDAGEDSQQEIPQEQQLSYEEQLKLLKQLLTPGVCTPASFTDHYYGERACAAIGSIEHWTPSTG